MTKELSDFIQIQAHALSIAHLDRLIVDLPALRERFTKIPSQTYAHLSDQLEFLSLFVEQQVAGLNPDLDTDPVAEAAFALLYFQHAADLIHDSIPGMGLLDDRSSWVWCCAAMTMRSSIVRMLTSCTGPPPVSASTNCNRLFRHSG